MPLRGACCAPDSANVKARMSPYRYVISLRVWHPSMPHEEISKATGMDPRRGWTSGDPRTTPKGEPLGGTRTSSYWWAPLTPDSVPSEPTEVEGTLLALLDQLRPLSPFFARMRSEQGKAEVFVGLYSENNLVIDLEPALMTQLSQASLSVCLDYYPWA